MASKQLSAVISKEQTQSDVLSSDCIRVECSNRVNIPPEGSTRINLVVYNTSTNGRMVQLSAQFDTKMINVHIPNSLIYVGPESKTVVFAIIHTLVQAGNCGITFDAF